MQEDTDSAGQFFGIDDLLIGLIALGQTIYENATHGGNFLEEFLVNFAIGEVFAWVGGNIFSGTSFTGTVGDAFLQAGKSLTIQSGLNSVLWELDNRHIINTEGGTLLAFFGGGTYSSVADKISYSQALGNILTNGAAQPGYSSGAILWISDQINPSLSGGGGAPKAQ